MSTVALPALPPATRATGRPGLARLTRVELRKMTDTRAGLWLLLGVLGVTLAVAVGTALTGSAEDHRLRDILGGTIMPASILLPVIGILLVASEYTQRTALITYALVPQRSRVLLAKLGAGVVLSLAALAVCVVVAVLATAVAAPGVDGTWSLPAGLFLQMVVYVVTGMVTGIAFGAALQASAPAIVAYFVLPIGWAIAGTLTFLEGAARWLDGSRTLDPMVDGLLSGTEWARALATLALWMVLPLAIGAWRLANGEVRA